MITKACNLTEDEIHNLISHHCCTMTENLVNEKMERLNYLHKRLKAFKEPEVAEQIKSDNSAAGWGNSNA